MPKDQKASSQLLSQNKKPNHLHAIHAVAVILPQSIMTSPSNDLATERIKSLLEQLSARGYERNYI